MFPGVSTQVAILALPHFHIYNRVFVQRAGETFAEATEVTGRLKVATLTASMDERARRLSMTLSRGAGTGSLSPLYGGSTYNDPGPLLREGGKIVLLQAITEPGDEPAPEDYYEWDRFRIDEYDAASGPDVVLQGRDAGSALYIDTWHEDITVYPADDAEVVMQQIKAAAGGITGATTIYLPDGPSGLPLEALPVGETTLDEVLARIALLRGWDFRNFPHDPETTHRFYDPGRARTTPDATITLSDYFKLEELKSSDADVRNAWRATYDKAGSRLQAYAEDAASIAAYGRKPARIHESETFGVDDEAYLQALVEYALADTKDPYASHRVRAKFWPYVELNDLHAYPANGQHYDSEQKFAVVSYAHTFGQRNGRTGISVRGKPLAAYRRWRKGSELPVIVSTNDPPAGGYAAEGTLWVKVDA